MVDHHQGEESGRTVFITTTSIVGAEFSNTSQCDVNKETTADAVVADTNMTANMDMVEPTLLVNTVIAEVAPAEMEATQAERG